MTRDDFAELLVLMLATILVAIAINDGPGGLYQWFRTKFFGLGAGTTPSSSPTPTPSSPTTTPPSPTQPSSTMPSPNLYSVGPHHINPNSPSSPGHRNAP